MSAAGTLSLAVVVGIWALWLAQQEGAWRLWRILTFAVLPIVATTIALSAAVASPGVSLGDLALGEALFCAVLVAIGTLVQAGRANRLQQS